MSTIEAPTKPTVSRRFGVEIECGHSNGYRWVLNELRNKKIPHGSVGCDGSGVEVRTAPLRGEAGFRSLKKLMTHLVNIGCWTAHADGQHIHIEARDYRDDPAARARLIESYIANRDNIVKFVDPYRRNYGSCSNLWESRNKKVRPDLLEGLKRGETYSRGDVNLSNLRPNHTGTIEIRLHEGNLDFEKIEAWIRFWIDFLDRVKAAKRPLRSYVNDGTMFRGVKVDPAVRAKLKAAAKRYDEGHGLGPRPSTAYW